MSILTVIRTGISENNSMSQSQIQMIGLLEISFGAWKTCGCQHGANSFDSNRLHSKIIQVCAECS